MLHNGFFEKKGPFPFETILKEINSVDDFVSFKKKKIYGIDTLTNAKEKEITFLNSSKYAKISIKTNAFACITSPNLSKFLPKSCITIRSSNSEPILPSQAPVYSNWDNVNSQGNISIDSNNPEVCLDGISGDDMNWLEYYEFRLDNVSFMAGYKIGVFKSVNDIKSNWKKNRDFTPKLNKSYRNKLLQGWKQAIRKTLA